MVAKKSSTIRNLTIGVVSVLAVAGVIFWKNKQKNRKDENLETEIESEDDKVLESDSDLLDGKDACAWKVLKKSS